MENIGYGTVLNLFYIPGTLIGGLLMDKIGRKQTMTLGFVLWSILGFVIGGALHQILPIFPLFVVLYGIFNTLGEMGPGVSRRPRRQNENSTCTQANRCRLRRFSAAPSPFLPLCAATSSGLLPPLERPARPSAPRSSSRFKTHSAIRTRAFRAFSSSVRRLP